MGVIFPQTEVKLAGPVILPLAFLRDVTQCHYANHPGKAGGSQGNVCFLCEGQDILEPVCPDRRV